MIRLMNAEGGDIHMPVNIGNPGEFTMKELADEVANATGKAIEIEYLPLPQDDPRQRKPDIERAKALLSWEPTVPLSEGLRHTVEYFKQSIAT